MKGLSPTVKMFYGELPYDAKPEDRHETKKMRLGRASCVLFWQQSIKKPAPQPRKSPDLPVISCLPHTFFRCN
jgi:hypothetical protein